MKDNLFDGFRGVIAFFVLCFLIEFSYFEFKSYHKEQTEQIEILTKEVQQLKCSVDSLENYLCD